MLREPAKGLADGETTFGIDAERGLLDGVALPVPTAEVTLSSGRRYALESGADTDRMTIRSRAGEVVLRVEVTDRGPVLSFAGAELELASIGRLRLVADRVDIEAAGDLALSSGANILHHAARNHEVRARGDARTEASAVELQASTGGVGIRAMRAIRLDGEHIGLNDDPLPAPFPWSDLAREERARDDTD